MTRRSVLIFSIVAALLVAGAWLLAIRHRYEPSSSSTNDGGGGAADAVAARTGSDVSGPFVGNDSRECFQLRKKYIELWTQSTGCNADTDCVVEKREPLAAGLYDCYRFSNRSLSHAEADGVAREWQTLGCTDPLSVATRDADCPVLPAVHCQKNRCIERPQPPVPIDWRRFYVDHGFRIFLPPDFEHTPNSVGMGRGTTARLAWFQGDGRALEVSLSTYGGLLTKESVADGEMTLFVNQEPILIDGHPSTLFRTKDRYADVNSDSGVHSTWGMAEIVDVGPAGLGYASYKAGMSSNLRFTMSCKSAERCEPMRLILEQTDVLLVVNPPRDAPRDDGGVRERRD